MAAVPSIGRAARVEGAPAPEADLTRALYEQYGNQLFRYCLHQLGTREEAEDAVQSTFLNAFRGIKRGVVPELESAWLFKIAHNVCLSRRRTSWRRGRIESPTDFDVVEELTPAPSRRADELIGLQDVLEQMPENQRRAILLREWQGLSYREIGEELELSQAAVETLIFRARRSLAAGLEQPLEAKRRLVRGTDLGNLLAGIKSLLVGGGAAVKVAATVAVVSASTVVAAAPVQESHARSHHPAAQAPAHSASAPAAGAVAGAAASFPQTAVNAGAKSSTPSRLELFARLGAASTRVSTPDPSMFAAPPAPAPAAAEPASVTPAAAEAPPAQSAAPAVEPQHTPAASVPAVAPASTPAPTAKGGDSKTNDSAKVSVPATPAPPVATTPVLPSQGSQGSQGSAGRGGEHNGNGSGDSKGSDTKKTGAPIVTLPAVTLAVQPQTTTTAPVVSLTTTTTTAPAVIVTQQAGNSKSDDKKSISTPPTPAAPVPVPAATVTLPVVAPTLTTVANAIGVAVLASVQAATGKTKDRRDKGGDNNNGNDNH